MRNEIQSLIDRLSQCESEWPVSLRDELIKALNTPDVSDFRVARFAAVRDFLAGSLKGKQTAAALKLDIQAAVDKLTEIVEGNNPEKLDGSATVDDTGLRAAVEKLLLSCRASYETYRTIDAKKTIAIIESILSANQPSPSSQEPDWLAMLKEMRYTLKPVFGTNKWTCFVWVAGVKYFFGDTPADAIRAAWVEWKKQNQNNPN
jgi:hypothetical protein